MLNSYFNNIITEQCAENEIVYNLYENRQGVKNLKEKSELHKINLNKLGLKKFVDRLANLKNYCPIYLICFDFENVSNHSYNYCKNEENRRYNNSEKTIKSRILLFYVLFILKTIFRN